MSMYLIELVYLTWILTDFISVLNEKTQNWHDSIKEQAFSAMTVSVI